jgi:acyl-coenzyme A thioesterase PaaI-like protein
VTQVFSQASAVELVAPRRYRAEIHDGWDIGGNANGGYVLAIAGRAMADAAERPPFTVTAHYLAPAPAGPCEIVVEPVRVGQRLATYTASLVQGDRELIRVLGTFGQPAESPAQLIDGAPPALPPYDQCPVGGDPTDPQLPGLSAQLAVRLRPGDDGFRTGEPSGRAEMAGWFAFAAEEPIDEIGLLLAADAMAPAVFNTNGSVGWVPTVELTVHVRARPAPGPLRCMFRTRFIAGGMLEEDGEIWDARDTLVAQSRQLALTPR